MIKRKLFCDLEAHLDKKEISFIIGPRQAGKTTLMLFLKEFLEKRGKRTLFLNLDIEQDKEFLESQSLLIRKIELELGREKGFVFIDEIQRKENAGLFLKGIYDMNLAYKFIVSGSGSVELKEKVHESLMGRKRLFELSTLSFDEFVNFRTEYKYEKNLLEFFSINKVKADELLDEYLKFGGYPRIVLEDEFGEKKLLINEIYQSYIERDIAYLLKVHKTEAFNSLLKLMAAGIGNLTNYSELSSTLAISLKTVKDYLWYMEKTFVLRKVTPFFRNIRKEISKSPMYYFYDLGLRNFAYGEFGEPKEKGFLFQNFIFNILEEKTKLTPAEIHFWRSKEKAEVDFVFETPREIIPIEVKYKKLKEPEVTKSLRSFIKKYKPQRAIVVNLSYEGVVSINTTKVFIQPYYKLMAEKLAA